MAGPPDRQIEALLDEALAQYRAHPSDYLEGVVTGLMRMLAREPDRSWCDMWAQDGNAGDPPPPQGTQR